VNEFYKKLHIPTGVSLSLELYEQIEQSRGQKSRSKFIENILSAALNKTPSTKLETMQEGNTN